MPEPKTGESRSGFISRCMSYPDLQSKPQRQRLGECYGIWRGHRRKHGKKSYPDDPVKLLDTCRSCGGFGYSYKLHDTGSYALDASPTPAEKLDIDRSAMAATVLFADGNRRDRVGDLLEIDGILTDHHRLNPIVLLDHGKHFPLPIAKTVDPSGRYTVWLDGIAKKAMARTYFSQSLLEAEQVFSLIDEGIMSAGSIGYRNIRVVRLPPDPIENLPPGLHLQQTELLEVTWTGLPAHPETARAALDRDLVCGKSLAPAVRHSLEPFAAPRKVWANGHDFGTGVIPMATKAFQADTVSDPESYGSTGKSPEPYGAQILRRMCEDLDTLLEHYEEMSELLEHANVGKHVKKFLEDVQDAKIQTSAIFQKEYPDLPPLDSDQGAGEGEETGSPAAEPSMGGEPSAEGAGAGEAPGTGEMGAEGEANELDNEGKSLPGHEGKKLPDDVMDHSGGRTPHPDEEAATRELRHHSGQASAALRELSRAENVQSAESPDGGMMPDHLNHHEKMLDAVSAGEGRLDDDEHGVVKEAIDFLRRHHDHEKLTHLQRGAMKHHHDTLSGCMPKPKAKAEEKGEKSLTLTPEEEAAATQMLRRMELRQQRLDYRLKLASGRKA